MANELECANFWFQKSLLGIFPIGFKFNNGISPKPTEKSNEAQNEYQQKCGMYDKEILECIKLDTSLNTAITTYANDSSMYFEDGKNKNLPTLIANYKKEYADKSCIKKIEKYRQSELGKVVDKFSVLDNQRIQAESIYERNQRIFFGGLVLIGGIVIFTIFSKNK